MQGSQGHLQRGLFHRDLVIGAEGKVEDEDPPSHYQHGPAREAGQLGRCVPGRVAACDGSEQDMMAAGVVA